MGLDMYAYKSKVAPKSKIERPLDSTDDVLLYNWWKHPNLHGWMQDRWESYGGEIHN